MDLIKEYAWSFAFVFLLVMSSAVFHLVRAREAVTVEFFYWDPSTDSDFCAGCYTWHAQYEDFQTKNEIVGSIQKDFGNNVSVEWIEYYSSSGHERRQAYNITFNSLVINGEFKIEGAFNETYVRSVIDSYIRGTPLLPSVAPPLTAFLSIAFSFGFFETFSPCLILLLSFIFSYTIEKTSQFGEGAARIVLFGSGFVIAAASVGFTVGLLFLHLNMFRHVLLWVFCVLAVFFGLNLLGLLKLPSFERVPLIKRLSRQYAITYGGLFLLGFIFYFLDPCIAPFFFGMLPLLTLENLLLIVTVFSLGAFLPFIAAGMLAGYISRLTRGVYRHKSEMRAISGLILIAYALYVIVYDLVL